MQIHIKTNRRVIFNKKFLFQRLNEKKKQQKLKQ
jgi:hypothetical protein